MTTPNAADDFCRDVTGIWGDRTCPRLAEAGHCRNCPIYAERGRTLLDRKPSREYIEELAHLISQPKEVAGVNLISVVIFRLGVVWMALPTDCFQEAASLRPIHSLPHGRDDFLHGLVNINGELLICVDLKEIFGRGLNGFTGDPGANSFGRLLVIRREGEKWVIPVDEVEGVARVRVLDFDSPDFQENEIIIEYCDGWCMKGERAVMILAEDLLFSSLSRRIT